MKFLEGDRVIVYGRYFSSGMLDGITGTVLPKEENAVSKSGYMDIRVDPRFGWKGEGIPSELTVHEKQCRRLRKKEKKAKFKVGDLVEVEDCSRITGEWETDNAIVMEVEEKRLLLKCDNWCAEDSWFTVKQCRKI